MGRGGRVPRGAFAGQAARLCQQPAADRQSPRRRGGLAPGRRPVVLAGAGGLSLLGMAASLPVRIAGGTARLLFAYARRRYADLPQGGGGTAHRSRAVEDRLY